MKQSGLGIASLVFGIIGFCLSCVIIGVVPCAIGLILAIVGFTQKDRGHGTAIAGLVCSVIGIGIFLLEIFVIGASGSDSSAVPNISTVSETMLDSNENIEEEKEIDETQEVNEKGDIESEEYNQEESEADLQKDDDIPTEYKSALKKAITYSDAMSMSKKAIYDQLTSEYGEKFSEEAAQYAMENIEADWNYNALVKAQLYSDEMYMSKAAIYDQLVSEYGEQFTQEEADYAVSNLK